MTFLACMDFCDFFVVVDDLHQSLMERSTGWSSSFVISAKSFYSVQTLEEFRIIFESFARSLLSKRGWDAQDDFNAQWRILMRTGVQSSDHFCRKTFASRLTIFVQHPWSCLGTDSRDISFQMISDGIDPLGEYVPTIDTPNANLDHVVLSRRTETLRRDRWITGKSIHFDQTDRFSLNFL